MNADSSLQATLEEHFRWFHMHPELSMEESGTSLKIREILSGVGVETLELGLETGVLARVRGTEQGGEEVTVALRADIDALPIKEESGLPYASLNDGKMHACGHDFHMTSLLGAAMLLQKKQGSLPGTVKLVFQPAEEGVCGAQKVIDTGLLDDVREIYGLHVAADLNPGEVEVCAGADHAAVDRFAVHVTGRGGHAAEPHHAADPVVALAQFINAAQGIVSRNVDPFDRAVLSITQIHSGTTWNVIPNGAFAEGTIRTLCQNTRERMLKRLREIGKGVSLSSGADVQIDIENLSPATDNDPELAAIVADTARELGMPVVPVVPNMGGEDFSMYQQRMPGVFFSVGVGSPRPLHNSAFIANPAPLAAASSLMAALAEKALRRIPRSKPKPPV
ncbi:MAG: amidohydrolase [Synergistaceae bacterium]|jgi:amidohydrolase|nr:amidohydrolase [Synergistaceae bacterium]